MAHSPNISPFTVTMIKSHKIEKSRTRLKCLRKRQKSENDLKNAKTRINLPEGQLARSEANSKEIIAKNKDLSEINSNLMIQKHRLEVKLASIENIPKNTPLREQM